MPFSLLVISNGRQEVHACTLTSVCKNRLLKWTADLYWLTFWTVWMKLLLCVTWKLLRLCVPSWNRSMSICIHHFMLLCVLRHNRSKKQLMYLCLLNPGQLAFLSRDFSNLKMDKYRRTFNCCSIKKSLPGLAELSCVKVVTWFFCRSFWAWLFTWYSQRFFIYRKLGCRCF